MRAKNDHRAAAVALREAGHTYDEIATELGVSKGSLSLWLRNLPFPTDEQRVELEAGASGDVRRHQAPTSRDSDREGARAMRLDGLLLREIAEHYKVSVKTACIWCADLPAPARARHGADREHVRRMNRLRWDAELAVRDAERSALKATVAQRVGVLSERELELVAVAAYWCEGSKDKSYARRERVAFINSDPGLIAVWLEWLHRRGYGREQLRFHLSIHESADLAAATRYWAEVVGVDVRCFGKPTIKRHNPKTVRKNIGEAYVGCLLVRVLQGRLLYQEIEGIWRGIVLGALQGDGRVAS